MNFFELTILSIVEGITEFLPISSTGHLILTSHLLGIEPTEFVTTFEIAIQLGAILAVAFNYYRQVVSTPKIVLYVFFSFLPTALIGALFYPLIKSVFFQIPQITLYSLFLGGFFMIFFHKLFTPQKLELSHLSIKKALFIGLVQSISIIPGVSRAAAGIIGAMLSGLGFKSAVTYSFLIALPTIAGAVFLDLASTPLNFSSNQIFQLLVGATISFFSALATMRWFVRFLQSHTLAFFGYYRILLSIIYPFFV